LSLGGLIISVLKETLNFSNIHYSKQGRETLTTKTYLTKTQYVIYINVFKQIQLALMW